MKLNVEVDLEDFLETFGADCSGSSVTSGDRTVELTYLLEDAIIGEIKAEVMKLVKKDPKYNAYINKKASEFLDGIKL